MNAAPRGRREHAVGEDREVEHRRAAATLDRHEGGKQHGGGRQRHDDDGIVPAGEAAARDAEHEAGEPGHERERAGQVEAAHRVAARKLAQHEPAPRCAGEAERHVEPEDPVPGQLHEHPAEYGSEHQAHGGDHGVGAHCEPQLALGEGVGHERGGIGEEEGAADALDDPPEDQLGAVGAEAGSERREREDQEAGDVRSLAAEEVGEAAGREHQHGRRDHVREDHPDQLEQGRAEAPLELGQGDDQGARVDRREQHPEAGTGERPPFVVLVLGGDSEPVA